ncbi:hypothetical protein C8J57DRAFT_1237078 [Mycena rebaudengoi]|nr:hypothetical protein C8J57DRAFT_1237078 [Mycena rebaudengoi]
MFSSPQSFLLSSNLKLALVERSFGHTSSAGDCSIARARCSDFTIFPQKPQGTKAILTNTNLYGKGAVAIRDLNDLLGNEKNSGNFSRSRNAFGTTEIRRLTDIFVERSLQGRDSSSLGCEHEQSSLEKILRSLNIRPKLQACIENCITQFGESSDESELEVWGIGMGTRTRRRVLRRDQRDDDPDESDNSVPSHGSPRPLFHRSSFDTGHPANPHTHTYTAAKTTNTIKAALVETGAEYIRLRNETPARIDRLDRELQLLTAIAASKVSTPHASDARNGGQEAGTPAVVIHTMRACFRRRFFSRFIPMHPSHRFDLQLFYGVFGSRLPLPLPLAKGFFILNLSTLSILAESILAKPRA